MSPAEKLDPLPDTFILQPPVFHPVSSRLPSGWASLQVVGGRDAALAGGFPSTCPPELSTVLASCSHLGVVPYVTTIFGGLRAGKMVMLQGVVPLDARRGASFRILFLFGHEDMKVSVNGQHFLHYRYRLPLSRVDTLGIFGDILVKAVGFLNINPFPEGGSEYPVGHVIVLRGLVLPEPKE
ncbi:Galectin-12 [Myotis brandtii]|uniref:Galectin n=1 Tax=Myotis brandtii TaxID=109478 RepID=S7NX63_MYOBR|nr:Galectin-12 [Myotis brandtii]